ncbi:MAG: hypothetical protein KatS3mg042_1384 [Rhodothermaceae bacterium]|nr:MAG: hypothetical protein KatS3mg042_1384 [Rhodothermaceae bacterium]
MDPFLIGLLSLLVLGTVLALIQTYRRDPCLRDFDGFYITLAEQDGDLCWGRAEIFPTGLEIVYPEPVRAPEGHLERSFIFYRDQYEALDALYRFPGGLSDEERARRERVIRRTARPGLLRKLGRCLRNWIGMVRDALLQAIGLVIGAVKSRSPGTVVLGSQEQQIKALSSEVIGHVGNAFDPLLERHLYRPVVVELTRQGRKYSYCGWLKLYSSRFVEIVDVIANGAGTPLPPGDYAPGDAQLATLGLDVRVEAGRLRLHNQSPHVLFARDVEAGTWQRRLGCMLPPGHTADLVLPPETPPVTVRVGIGAVERFDMVVPRTHAIIRHAAQPGSLPAEAALEEAPTLREPGGVSPPAPAPTT